MVMIELVLADVRQFLELQLAAARRTHRSVAESTAKIVDELRDLGLDWGFVPLEPKFEPGFRRASVVIAFNDYITEETITV